MEKEKDQELEEQKTPEATETLDGGVEVTLEEEKEVETPQEQEEEKKVPQKSDRDTKLKNQLGYQERIIGKLQREVEELKTKQPASQPAEPQPEQGTFLDTLQKDPEGAIKRLAQSETQRIVAEERKKIDEQTQYQTTRNEIDKNTQLVLERHSELNDTTSEKSEIWLNILNEHPSWKNYPDGPLFVMREMEEKLRQKGYDVDGSVTKKVEAEKDRLARVVGTSTPSSRLSATSNKIVLTKEQRELCDENGWDYASYARNLKTLETKGEVKV